MILFFSVALPTFKGNFVLSSDESGPTCVTSEVPVLFIPEFQAVYF